jgi:DNA replication protein DnaC
MIFSDSDSGVGSSRREKKIFAAEQLDLTKKQYSVLTKCLEGHNIAIHGSAGSGKSHLLKRICTELRARG